MICISLKITDLKCLYNINKTKTAVKVAGHINYDFGIKIGVMVNKYYLTTLNRDIL